jgi:hypothetical protein
MSTIDGNHHRQQHGRAAQPDLMRHEQLVAQAHDLGIMHVRMGQPVGDLRSAMKAEAMGDESGGILREKIEGRKAADQAARHKRQQAVAQARGKARAGRHQQRSEAHGHQHENIIGLEARPQGQQQPRQKKKGWPGVSTLRAAQKGEYPEKQEGRGDEVVRHRHASGIEQDRIEQEERHQQRGHRNAQPVMAPELPQRGQAPQPGGEDHQAAAKQVMIHAGDGKDPVQQDRQVRQMAEIELLVEALR